MTTESEKSQMVVEVDGEEYRVSLTTSANSETREWRAAIELNPPANDFGAFLREMAGSVTTPPGTLLDGMTLRGRFQ